jgi:hypothetical protein
MDKDDFIFEGFDPANTTPVPDVFFDVLLPRLNEAQIKVMMYIIRRTLGFKKTSDAISLKQFRNGIITRDGRQLDQGCGLKNFTAITKALKFLEEIGCIESEKRKTADGDSATTVYRIRFRGTARNVVPTTPKRVGVLREKDDGTTRRRGPVLREKEPQETVIQQTDSQETVIQGENNKRATSKSQKPDSSPSSQNKSSLSSEKKSLSPEVVAILDCWDEIRGEKIPRSDKQKKAAKELAEVNATKEKIQAVEQFCLQDNPEWFVVHGIDLQSISNNWSKWQTAQANKGKATSSKSRTTSKVLSSYDDEDYIDDTFYKARKVEAINGKH